MTDMDNQTANDLTHELFRRVQSIKLGDPAGIFGTTSNQSMLQDLKKAVGELGVALTTSQSHEVVAQKFDALSASIDTASVTGVIGKSELEDYYKLMDSLWAAIERENNAD